MKFIDFFAGIGGFRNGFEKEGHQAVGWCELDKFAQESYRAIYDTEGEWFAEDITEVNSEDMPYADIYTAGIPCQAFSVAGKRGGFEDTRGTLFFDVMRLAKENKPKFIIFENVKGLLSHDKGKTFNTMLNVMNEFGYEVEYQLLNSKNFGVPQNRERVYFIGHLDGIKNKIFPLVGFSNGNINQIGNIVNYDNNFKNPQTGRVYDDEGISPTINTMQGGNLEPKVIQKAFNTIKDNNTVFDDTPSLKVREATKKGYDVARQGDSVNYQFPNSKTHRGRVGKKIANTLETSDNQGVVTNDLRIRKLTPRECWRLQGFSDNAFDKAASINSNSQLYKQAGNSLTTTIAQSIATKII